MSSTRPLPVVDRELSRRGTTRRKTMRIVLALRLAKKAATSQHCGEYEKYNSSRPNRLTNYKAIRQEREGERERERERERGRGKEAESELAGWGQREGAIRELATYRL